MNPDDTRHEPTSDRIVIQEWPGGHKLIIKARLLATAEACPFPPASDDLTAVGGEFLPVVAAADGIQIATVYRHGILYRPFHPALWSWDEIDQAVIDASKTLLGVDELDVVRETPGNGTTS